MLMTSKKFINKSLKYQQGSIYERMAVSPEDLLNIEVPVPSIKIQKKISVLTKHMIRLINNSFEAYNDFLRLKKYLLDKLFI
ncbi:Restriction endonuclease S subunit, fragment [Alteracholeplasma palmae J233]|uniref:Restriction endonuclease S subunit n=2 Tax=Acholeplasma palmae TaxID=38986 RepID=U4KR56_ALTPJ|nr:Restriction endonuclease S subunit, fragment [Alteracholeplasma palmae J233]